MVSLDDLFRRSDVISLHCPLTEQTKGLVNAQRLALLKPTALLINTSRGPLVVEADLAAALNAGGLAGAALDVLSTEPPARDNPLLAARNCMITPHLAWATRAARKRLLETATANVRALVPIWKAPRFVVSSMRPIFQRFCRCPNQETPRWYSPLRCRPAMSRLIPISSPNVRVLGISMPRAM